MVNDQLAFLVSKQGGIGLAEPMVNQMMAQIKNRSWTQSMSGPSELGNGK
jgi:Rod binding domain-containing protein